MCRTMKKFAIITRQHVDDIFTCTTDKMDTLVKSYKAIMTSKMQFQDSFSGIWLGEHGYIFDSNTKKIQTQSFDRSGLSITAVHIISSPDITTASKIVTENCTFKDLVVEIRPVMDIFL